MSFCIYFEGDVFNIICYQGGVGTLIQQLLPAEWISILQYCTSVGYYNALLCEAAARWARKHSSCKYIN